MLERTRKYLSPLFVDSLSTLALLCVLVLLPVRLVCQIFARRTFSVWTGTPVLTLPVKARAEKLLGVNAKTLVWQTSYITDQFDINLSRWKTTPIVGILVPYVAFVWACMRLNRLHSFCDRGILPTKKFMQYNKIELFTYRLIGIQVFLWTYGADVRSRKRTMALGTPNCCMDCTLIGKACICDDEVQSRYMAYLHRNVTAIFALGDMTEYSQNSIDTLFFWPIDLNAKSGEKYIPVYPPENRASPLRVVHAPNHRMFKGTRFLEEAIDQLKREGESIELIMVERLSNEAALSIYRSADVIFDQCLIGSFGYTTLEAMALGKPVMCFIRKEEYLLAPEEYPGIQILPETIAPTLRALIEDRTSLNRIGRQGRIYVEKHFSIEAFSSRLGTAMQRFS